jgi:hypothetical protein
MIDQHNADARGNGRRRAIDSYGDVGRRASEGIDEAPLIALAGGIAAGALLAALLPRTQVESRALRPVGDRLSETARAAATAAREAGESRLSELGLTADKGRETLRAIFEGASDAAKTSAQAAFSAARSSD